MRSAEWISVAFFTLFLVAAAFAPLDGRKRLKAIGIGLTGTLVAGTLQLLEALPTVDVIRDVIPALFLLMAYWQSGQFFTGSNPKLQAILRRFDERWFPGVLRIASSLEKRPILSTYLEAAYLMCYPTVVLGLATLFLMGERDVIDQFWRVVLPPSYACYGLIALFQSLPPRLVETDEGVSLPRSNLRSLNLWVLRHASIRANTLPSAHVAQSFAVALVSLKLIPVAGAAFLWIAGSIALATAVLRYHYTIDTVLGVALAVLSFVLFG